MSTPNKGDMEDTIIFKNTVRTVLELPTPCIYPLLTQEFHSRWHVRNETLTTFLTIIDHRAYYKALEFFILKEHFGEYA